MLLFLWSSRNMQNMILYVNEIGTKMLNFFPKLEDYVIILKKVKALGPDL